MRWVARRVRWGKNWWVARRSMVRRFMVSWWVNW